MRPLMQAGVPLPSPSKRQTRHSLGAASLRPAKKRRLSEPCSANKNPLAGLRFLVSCNDGKRPAADIVALGGIVLSGLPPWEVKAVQNE
jgi:hypothetical protein